MISNHQLFKEYINSTDRFIGFLEKELMDTHNTILNEGFVFTVTRSDERIKQLVSYVHTSLYETSVVLEEMHFGDELDTAEYAQYELVLDTLISRYQACKKHYAQDVQLRINFRR